MPRERCQVPLTPSLFTSANPRSAHSLNYSMTFDDLRGFLYSERKIAGPSAFLDTKVMGGGCNKQCYVTEKLHCIICGLLQTTSFRQSGP